MNFTIYLYLVQCQSNCMYQHINLYVESLKLCNSYFMAWSCRASRAGQKKWIQARLGKSEGGRKGSPRHSVGSEVLSIVIQSLQSLGLAKSDALGLLCSLSNQPPDWWITPLQGAGESSQAFLLSTGQLSKPTADGRLQGYCNLCAKTH